MKKIFTILAAVLLVMSTYAAPNRARMRGAEMPAGLPTVSELRAAIASTPRMPILSHAAGIVEAQKDYTLPSVNAAQAVYYEGSWELDLFDAADKLLGYILYTGGDATHLVASDLEVNDSTNFVVFINGTDTIRSIAGSFSVAFDSEVSGVPYYHIFSMDLTSDEEGMDFDIVVPVTGAFDYEKYFYSYYYSDYCGTWIDCNYIIYLEDAPFVMTDIVVTETLNDLEWEDAVSSSGWWQIIDYSADSSYFVSVSPSYTYVVDGTYDIEDMDAEYTYIYVGERLVVIKSGTFVVTTDEATETVTVVMDVIGRDGVTYHFTLTASTAGSGSTGGSGSSDNVITLSHNNGNIVVSTTNNDSYFFIIESKEEYDGYESDFSVSSLNEEIDAWISSTNNYGVTAYFLYSGNQTINANEFYTDMMSDDGLEDGVEYVALAAGCTSAGSRTTDGVYVLFTHTATAVENVATDVKAQKRIVNGALLIERNGAIYNAQGIRQ